MTPEQRVADLMRSGWGAVLVRHLAPDVLEDLEQAVALIVREAEADRTAHCARVAEGYRRGQDAAVAIRARDRGD